MTIEAWNALKRGDMVRWVLKCPYCGCVYTNDDEYKYINEHGKEVLCVSCCKPFWALREMTVIYFGVPAIEDQEKPK